MKILYVDDERSAHINFQYMIKEKQEISNVEYCYDYEHAIEFAKLNTVDCAFLDITLAGRDGITLAKELKKIQPNIEIAFVTGFDEYAREAYKVGGRAYISKPYGKEELDHVFELMEKLAHPPNEVMDIPYSEEVHIFARTFGGFDLLLDGNPIHFKNAKAKELMAYLVNQMGGTVSNAQIFFALWEKQEYTRSTSTYVRRTIRALKEELEEHGIGEIFIVERNSSCLDVKKITCDAYELLEGSAAALRKYNGQYMSQYYWGEETIPVLDRVVETLKK